MKYECMNRMYSVTTCMCLQRALYPIERALKYKISNFLYVSIYSWVFGASLPRVCALKRALSSIKRAREFMISNFLYVSIYSWVFGACHPHVYPLKRALFCIKRALYSTNKNLRAHTWRDSLRHCPSLGVRAFPFSGVRLKESSTLYEKSPAFHQKQPCSI